MPAHPSRVPASTSVGAAASVAALSRSHPTMQPCAHLIHLAEVLNEVAAPLLDGATHRAACLAQCPPGGRTYADTAAIFDQGAAQAAALKSAEQLLRQLAHDPEYQRFAEAQTLGRVIVAQEADRPGPVVVAREQDAARAVPLVQRVRGGLRRLFQRAAA